MNIELVKWALAHGTAILGLLTGLGHLLTGEYQAGFHELMIAAAAFGLSVPLAQARAAAARTGP